MAWGTTAANPKAIFKLTGLEPTLYYSLTIFGSRLNVSDNRETKYSAEGKSGVVSATLNTSNNTTNVAKIVNVQANANTEIIFTCEAGENNTSAEKFYYLGAMRISKSTQPNSVKALSDNMQLFYNNGVLKINQYTRPVQVFNMSGQTIAAGQSVFGSFAVSLQKGVYVLTTLQGNGKLTVMQ